jgi:hypothetical protein
MVGVVKVVRVAGLLLCCGVLANARGQMVMDATSLIQAEQQHGSSGTSVEPASTPVPMWMGTRGAWMLMLHGNGFAANTQQQAQSERATWARRVC